MRTNPAVSWVVLVFFCVTLCFCSGQKKEEDQDVEPIVGVKIYDYEGKLPELFAEWRDLGINSVFASESLLSNREFRDLTEKFNITTFVIIPVFFNPEELEKNPDLYAITDAGKKAIDDWVQFVCPTREDYRQQRISAIKQTIEKLDPNGISIDFIRFFVFWEKVYPDRTLSSITNTCFDSYCLDRFQKETGIHLPQELSEIPEKAAWIAENHLQSWAEWKCSVITKMVEEIAAEAKKAKPGVLINIHAVPWREKDFGEAIKIIAGQDIVSLSAYADIISPMCYSHMLKRQPAWISSVVKDLHNRSHSPVVPSIQVKEAYLTEILSVSEFRDSLIEALKSPSKGVIFWSWEALDKDPEKKDLIKILARNPTGKTRSNR